MLDPYCMEDLLSATCVQHLVVYNYLYPWPHPHTHTRTEPQARLTVTQGGERVLAKLKTRRKPQSCAPIFNEVLNCSVDPNKISGVAVNVDISNEHKQARSRALGQVTLCGQSAGEEFRHWSDVMAAPGKPIAEWHELR